MPRGGPPLRAIAYHEAGHAVMCWHEQIEVEIASIIPEAGSLGRVQHRSVLEGIDLACDNSLEGRARAESLIRVCLAGAVAQRQIDPRRFRHYNSRSDYESAQELLTHLAGADDELAAYWRLLQIQTKNILNLTDVWHCVERVADALLQSKALSADDIGALFLG
jgi:hypothetical protein